MERVVDILSVDDRAVDADIPLRVLQNSAFDDRVLRSKNGAAALSHLFGRDQLVRPCLLDDLTTTADAYIQTPADLDAHAIVRAKTPKHCLPRVLRRRGRESLNSLGDGRLFVNSVIEVS